jgi:anaerobic selenocysteine-containing dehydrogenase
MATESKGETTNVDRRRFLKSAAVGAATAAGFLAAAAFSSSEGVKSAAPAKNLGEGFGEGASIVATCGFSPNCSGGGGQCGFSVNCSGGGGKCGFGVNCSGT